MTRRIIKFDVQRYFDNAQQVNYEIIQDNLSFHMCTECGYSCNCNNQPCSCCKNIDRLDFICRKTIDIKNKNGATSNDK